MVRLHRDILPFNSMSFISPLTPPLTPPLHSVSTDLSSPVRGRANYLSKCTANLNADG